MDHVIILKKVFCKSLFSKAMGLRFHKKITDKAYIFSFDTLRQVSMDMFFVHFPIDVLFLDENDRLIEIKENFRPYTAYSSKKETKIVIEVPQGYIKKEKITLGDKIIF